MVEIKDPLELDVARALDAVGVKYIHEKQGAPLDFYLPDYGVHIECKAYHADRVIKQLAAHNDVILVQGYKAAITFARLIMGNAQPPKQIVDDFEVIDDQKPS